MIDPWCILLAGDCAAQRLVRPAAWLALLVVVTSCGYPELPAVPMDVNQTALCGDSEPMADGSGYLELSPPSCAGLATTCGPTAQANCCEAATVPGGKFYRGCDRATDDLFKDMDHPATVSAFVLDRYEVTVGRFRTFVNAGMGTQASRPAPGTGAHPALPDSGWNSTWDMNLPLDTAALKASVKCEPTYETWTDAPGVNEARPIGCVTWYEAMAFCIWDGGYLPTEAEWNFAAGGGSEHHAYPWSIPASETIIDCGHANYQLSKTPAMYCVNGITGGTNRVGSESPTGDGKWGHSDLAGNVLEWTLDWYAAYQLPCVDCANLATPDPAERVLRGGDFFNEDVSLLRSANRATHHGPNAHSASYGLRCARTPDGVPRAPLSPLPRRPPLRSQD